MDSDVRTQKMPHPEQTVTARPISVPALANLSLGAAFGVSSLFSTGAKLIAATGTTLLLRLMQPFQQHILSAVFSYVLPAVLIYVLVRITRLDQRLRPNTFAQSTIFIANLLLVLYVATRVFASTIQGGGASFAVASLSVFVIFPAWLLLGLGFANLCTKSFRLGALTTTPKAVRFSSWDWMAIGLVLVVTIAFIATLPVQKAFALSSEFARLCKGAETKIVEAVPRARGVALLQDSFTTMSPGRRTESGPLAVFLLNQSLLDFVERPATKGTGIEGRAKYERMTTVGDRVLRSKPGSSAETQYSFEAADEITAEYVASSVPVRIERGEELRIGGARLEIRRRVDEHLIAYANYFWSNTELRVCPQEFQNGLSVYHFIVNALNVKNPDGPK